MSKTVLNIRPLAIAAIVFFVLWLCSVMPVSARADEPKPILHSKGLLWKIEKSGQPENYLFGTIHLDDPGIATLLPPISGALGRVQQFAMEVVMDFQAMGTFTRASFFDDGRNLKQLMALQDYKTLIDLLERQRGLSENVVNNMQPWALYALLSMPADKGGIPLDLQLEQRARQRGLSVHGLETVEEQIAALNGLPIDEQVWLLNNVVQRYEDMEKMFSVMLESYLQQDLGALMKLQQESMDDSSDIDDKLMHRLLDERNQKMADRIIRLYEQGSTFVAIGALHLPGEQGVLRLLEQRGYRVTPVE